MEVLIEGWGKHFTVREAHEVNLLFHYFSNGVPGYFIEWPTPIRPKGSIRTGKALIWIEEDCDESPSERIHMSSTHQFDVDLFSYFRIVKRGNSWVMEILAEVKEKKEIKA